MKKRVAPLCLALAAACLLCGCMPRLHLAASRSVPGYPRGETTPEPPQRTPAPTPQPTEPSSAVSETRQLYGSVGLLREPTVLVSIYLNDAAGGNTWDEDSMAASREKLALAVDWITDQCAAYGTDATLYYDDGTDATAGLRHTYLVQNRLEGGEDGESDEDNLAEYDALCETLDTQALHAFYGTENVGFLLFLPLDGCSFTMVHYTEDGPYYQQEYSCLYRYDMYSSATTPESPSVYAHELLHLFGAPDLYSGSGDAFVSDALVDYVEQTYPDEIMYDTYDANGGLDYTAIGQSISPIVAYRLGLAASCEELATFPDLAFPLPGTFAAAEDGAAGGPFVPGELPADLGVAARPQEREVMPCRSGSFTPCA